MKSTATVHSSSSALPLNSTLGSSNQVFTRTSLLGAARGLLRSECTLCGHTVLAAEVNMLEALENAHNCAARARAAQP
jgi:hypothetical protein